MSAHTQGQWSIRDDDEDGVVSIVGNSQIVIALVRTATVEPGDDNARLIATSPTMYEYIVRRAEIGDSEAKSILETINASR